MNCFRILLAVCGLTLSGFGQTNILGPLNPGPYGPVTKKIVTVTGQSFTTAARLTTTAQPANQWDAGIQLPVRAAVAQGDVLVGDIWLRHVAPTNGTAFVTFNFENQKPNYEKSITRTYSLSSSDWSRYRMAFRVVSNYAALGAQVTLFLGYPPQSLEVGPVALTNYGPNVTPAQFPNDLSYAGRESDAPWRAPAAARIEQYRKADLTLRLVDAGGYAITNGTVHVLQTRHQFGFGSAVDGPMLLGRRSGVPVSDVNRYRSVITNWFNKTVLENDLKWPVWEQKLSLPGQPFGPGTATNALKWLVDRGLPVRGHNLIWPSTNVSYFLPADLPSLFGDTNKLRQRINAHFTNILTQTFGKCVEWDVINEPYYNHTIMDLLGYGEMNEWFKLARALDSRPRLYLNEYGNLEAAGLNSPQTDDFFNKAKSLRDAGAPIDGLGMQSHFGDYLPNPADVVTMLDRFATLGLTIQATEFDINIQDPATQADYLHDFMTVMFSHPSVNAVVMWGFWEKQHWLPDAALFNKDWTLRPHGVAWSNLVFQEWRTLADLTPDSAGNVSLRGFKGDYEITATAGGVTNVLTLSLDTPTNRIATLDVPPPSLTSKMLGDGSLEFRWTSAVAGYRVEATPTLSPAHWTEVTGATAQPPSDWVLTVNPSTSGTMFYRLARPPLP